MRCSAKRAKHLSVSLGTYTVVDVLDESYDDLLVEVDTVLV